MAVCFVVWTYLPFKPNFPEYCQCTLRLISGHYTCLFYLNHDVLFYYHCYHKTWKLFRAPFVEVNWVVISNSVMPDSFTVTVWYWDIKWRTLIFHKNVKSDLKEDWHVMCIYMKDVGFMVLVFSRFIQWDLCLEHFLPILIIPMFVLTLEIKTGSQVLHIYMKHQTNKAGALLRLTVSLTSPLICFQYKLLEITKLISFLKVAFQEGTSTDVNG